MVKKTILGFSIGSFLIFIINNILAGLETSTASMIAMGVLIISLIVLIVLVFIDVKKNNNSPMWVVLTFIIGPIGSLIYSLIDKNNELSQKEADSHKKRSMRNGEIFNYIMSGIFFITAIFLLALSGTAGLIFFGLSLLSFIFARYLSKK